MAWNRAWKLAAGTIGAALVVGGVAGVAGIAGAEPAAKSTTFVDGFDKFTDDFNDHEREVGVLCDGCDNSQGTDLVVLWQSILVSHDLLAIDDVDGYFGPDTAKATAAWQQEFGLPETGEVAQDSWAAADDRLSDGDRVEYRGKETADAVGYVGFNRSRIEGGDGSYQFLDLGDPSGNFVENTSETNYIELSKLTIKLESDD